MEALEAHVENKSEIDKIEGKLAELIGKVESSSYLNKKRTAENDKTTLKVSFLSKGLKLVDNKISCLSGETHEFCILERTMKGVLRQLSRLLGITLGLPSD